MKTRGFLHSMKILFLRLCPSLFRRNIPEDQVRGEKGSPGHLVNQGQSISFSRAVKFYCLQHACLVVCFHQGSPLWRSRRRGMQGKMKDIRIGTSGYDYMDWVGAFYPEDLRREDFLEFYSRTSAPWSSTSATTACHRPAMKRFLEKSGPDMDISLKAHRSMTHEVGRRHMEGVSGRFRPFSGAASGGPASGRGASSVPLQLPLYPGEPPVSGSSYTRDTFAAPGGGVPQHGVAEQARPGLPAGAFRGLLLGGHSAPQGSASAAGRGDLIHSLCALPPATKNLWGSDAAARFDYLYSEEELKPWIERLAVMAAAAGRVRVYFNNHRRGQAPANAAMLRHLMEAM